MKRQGQIAALIFGLCASAAAIAADLDLNVNNNVIEGSYSANLTSTTQYRFGGLHDDRSKGWLAHAGFLAVGEHQAAGVKSSIAVGGRLYSGTADSNHALALALGGQFYYRPVDTLMVGISGHAFMAPNVLSGLDSVGMFDGGLALEFEVIKPTATVYVAYRKVLVKFKDNGTTTLDNGPEVGMRISF